MYDDDVKGYSYIKPQFRGHEGAVQPGFTGLQFRPTLFVRHQLTWCRRWLALWRLVSPQGWWCGLRYFRQQYWSEFSTGIWIEIKVGPPVPIVASKYAPGSEL